MSNLTQSRPNCHSPRWYGWLGLILALPVGLVVGWIFLRRRMEKQGFSNITAEIELPGVARDHQENHPPATPPVNHAKIDDLTIIRGIGGKVSAYLHSIGIHTLKTWQKLIQQTCGNNCLPMVSACLIPPYGWSKPGWQQPGIGRVCKPPRTAPAPREGRTIHKIKKAPPWFWKQGGAD